MGLKNIAFHGHTLLHSSAFVLFVFVFFKKQETRIISVIVFKVKIL